MNNKLKLALSLVMSFAAAAIGGLATGPNIPTWYAGLDKPWFNPPNWLFGPVWTVLYALIGISFYLVWRANRKESYRHEYVLFGVQLVLNAGWSLVFFGLHAPWAGLAIIVLLLATIITMIATYRHTSKQAAWLLVPYALWVAFATALNASIASLN